MLMCLINVLIKICQFNTATYLGDCQVECHIFRSQEELGYRRSSLTSPATLTYVMC